jgi:hypothetical protein
MDGVKLETKGAPEILPDPPTPNLDYWRDPPKRVAPLLYLPWLWRIALTPAGTP